MSAGDSLAAALDDYLSNPPRISSATLDDLYDEWAALHASNESRPPFSHPAWYRVWMRHFGGNARAQFLAVRDEEGLLGVVPLSFEGRDATLLGDPQVTDYAGICIRQGAEAQVIAAVLEWLMEDFAQTLAVWGVREECPLGPALIAAGERFGWKVTREEEALSPAAELPEDWESYVAGLPKKHRHELRRKLRNLEDAATVEVTEATGAKEVHAPVERLLVMMRESREDKAEFLTPAMEAFFRDLAETFAGLRMVRFSTLLLGGTPAAEVFAFEDDGTAYLYNSGYDPEQSHLAVGLLSKALVLRASITAGKSTFDFLRGDERYKAHLGGKPHLVERYTLRRR